MRIIFKDFFTDKEIENLLKGHDIFLEEKEIRKRFDKMDKL